MLGAVLLIAAREPIHSALSLILVMISLAVLYLLLGAEFIAAVQIIVYAGAIMVLFVFVIMLLNAGEEERTNWSKTAKYAGMPLGIVLLLWLAPLDGAFRERRGGGQWRGPARGTRFRPWNFRSSFSRIICSRLKRRRS